MTSTDRPYDEMLGRDDRIRECYAAYREWLDGESSGRLQKKSAEAEALFRSVGVTFKCLWGRRRR